MKKYLVFAGENYYPRPAWRDYKGSFDTKEEALKEVARVKRDWWQIVDRDTERIIETD